MSFATQVITEMERQDMKWGAQRDNPVEVDLISRLAVPTEERAKAYVDEAAAAGKPVAWSAILLEEICEAFNAATCADMQAELVQCAAVIGQWFLALDRQKRTPAEWQVLDEITVYDPDGWRLDGKSFDDPIFHDEWIARASRSTVTM